MITQLQFNFEGLKSSTLLCEYVLIFKRSWVYRFKRKIAFKTDSLLTSLVPCRHNSTTSSSDFPAMSFNKIRLETTKRPTRPSKNNFSNPKPHSSFLAIPALLILLISTYQKTNAAPLQGQTPGKNSTQNS